MLRKDRFDEREADFYEALYTQASGPKKRGEVEWGCVWEGTWGWRKT